MKSIYIDLEWSGTDNIFLMSYAYSLSNYGQLHGKELTKENILKLFEGVEYIFFYGPDVAKLEHKYKIKLKRNFHCVSLLSVFKTCNLPTENYKLATLEKFYKIERKANYKATIFKLYSDYLDPKKRKQALLYNMEDTLNMIKIKNIIFKDYSIRKPYLQGFIMEC